MFGTVPVCPVPVWMSYRGYRKWRHRYWCCTEFTEVPGTGNDDVPNVMKCPVPVLMSYRTYRSGIDVVPNLPKCSLPVLISYRTWRCVPYRQYRRYASVRTLLYRKQPWTFFSWEVHPILVALRSGISLARNCSASEKCDPGEGKRHREFSPLVLGITQHVLGTSSHEAGMLHRHISTRREQWNFQRHELQQIVLTDLSLFAFWGRFIFPFYSLISPVPVCRLLISTSMCVRSYWTKKNKSKVSSTT